MFSVCMPEVSHTQLVVMEGTEAEIPDCAKHAQSGVVLLRCFISHDAAKAAFSDTPSMEDVANATLTLEEVSARSVVPVSEFYAAMQEDGDEIAAPSAPAARKPRSANKRRGGEDDDDYEEEEEEEKAPEQVDGDMRENAPSAEAVQAACSRRLARIELSVSVSAIFAILMDRKCHEMQQFAASDFAPLHESVKPYMPSGLPLVQGPARASRAEHWDSLSDSQKIASWRALFSGWGVDEAALALVVVSCKGSGGFRSLLSAGGEATRWMGSSRDAQASLGGSVHTCTSIVTDFCLYEYMKLLPASPADKAARELMYMALFVSQVGCFLYKAPINANSYATEEPEFNEDGVEGSVTLWLPNTILENGIFLKKNTVQFLDTGFTDAIVLARELPPSAFTDNAAGKVSLLKALHDARSSRAYTRGIDVMYNAARRAVHKWSAANARFMHATDAVNLNALVLEELNQFLMVKMALKPTSPLRRLVLPNIDSQQQLDACVVTIAYIFDTFSFNKFENGAAYEEDIEAARDNGADANFYKLPVLQHLVSGLVNGTTARVLLGKYFKDALPEDKVRQKGDRAEGGETVYTLLMDFLSVTPYKKGSTQALSVAGLTETMSWLKQLFENTDIRRHLIKDTAAGQEQRQAEIIQNSGSRSYDAAPAAGYSRGRRRGGRRSRMDRADLESMLCNDTTRFGVQTARFWKFQIRTNGLQGIGFLLLRPFISHTMGSAIYIHGGGAAANTLMGHSKFRIGSDAARDLIFGQYTNYHKVPPSPSLYVYQPHSPAPHC